VLQRKHDTEEPDSLIFGSGYGYTSHDAVRIKRWVCHPSSTDTVV